MANGISKTQERGKTMAIPAHLVIKVNGTETGSELRSKVMALTGLLDALGSAGPQAQQVATELLKAEKALRQTIAQGPVPINGISNALIIQEFNEEFDEEMYWSSPQS